jgi:hypothetical protein
MYRQEHSDTEHTHRDMETQEHTHSEKQEQMHQGTHG